jgi:hypothetical protein
MVAGRGLDSEREGIEAPAFSGASARGRLGAILGAQRATASPALVSDDNRGATGRCCAVDGGAPPKIALSSAAGEGPR